MSGRWLAARPFQRLLRFALKRRMRKVLRRRAWASYKERNGWNDHPSPPWAYYGIVLLFYGSALLSWTSSLSDPDARGFLLVFGLASLVFSVAAFAADLYAPRQKPFQKRKARRTDGT